MKYLCIGKNYVGLTGVKILSKCNMPALTKLNLGIRIYNIYRRLQYRSDRRSLPNKM